ncbi:low density lipoprotein receptor adapter protein 1-like [Haliotis asinina]|uniref:low density lipoprotein receptor adapter protein 1-like n=1 Tax=Haliotis asinina TaxID=109174 RepID=UPI003531CCCD
MDAFLRAVRKSPTVSGKSRHKKLGEGWGESENNEVVDQGVTFYMKYLGSILVEELPDDESYGDGISSRAVQTIVAMAKSAGKKLKKVSLTVSPTGIRMTDLLTKEVSIDMSIYRISFCTADKNHEKVFAFIARNSINETMECHAYFCAKRKLAQAVTLTVSQAFGLAQEKWENKQNSKTQKDIANHQKVTKHDNFTRSHDVIKPLPGHKGSTAANYDPFLAIPGPPQVQAPGNTNKQQWQEFGDREEDLEDDFSRLAQNRGRRLHSFSTDLCKEDVDESVQQYMDGQRCFEEFSRQKSIEDLLNL